MNKLFSRAALGFAILGMAVSTGAVVSSFHLAESPVSVAAASQDVTFLPGHFTGQGATNTGGPVAYSQGGVTVSSAKGYGTTQLRIYSGGTLTISPDDGYSISAVSFAFSETKYNGGLSSSTSASFTYSPEETSAISYSMKKQARITKLVVTVTPPQTDDYISSLSGPEAYVWNAGDIVTPEKIGTISSVGSEAGTSENYTEYTCELVTYDGTSESGSSLTVVVGSTYVSYTDTYNHVKFVAHLPTTAGGSEYASLYIPLTINVVTSPSFDLALSSDKTTAVTSRSVLEGVSENLAVINTVAGAYNNVNWTTSNEEVVTVSSSGAVTAVSVGTATITATSKVTNADGAYVSASVEYTVLAAPVYSLYFNSSSPSFTDIAAANVSAPQTVYETIASNGLEWTLKTVSTDSTNVRIVAPTATNSFLQVGTTNNPAVEFSLRSNVFGSAKTKITKVEVVAFGAAGASSANIGLTADSGEFVASADTLSGTKTTTFTFTSEGAYGHIEINFTNVQRGIKIASVLVSAETDTSDLGLAYAFASKVEPVSTCNSSSKTELLMEYAGLSESVKSIADGITLYDRPSVSADDYGSTAKKDQITLAEKIAVLQRMDVAGSSLTNIVGSETATNAIALIAICSIDVLTVGGLLLARKKEER